ncbi:MAG: four helix bundle protein [Chitinophagales bacterium]
MSGLENLISYQKAFDLSMRIFEISKTFPEVEKFALISQIRRSSRSVCANMAEAYRKRQYEAHFQSKLSDADAENSETIVWLHFSLYCGYIEKDAFADLKKLAIDIGKLLNYMIWHPQEFMLKHKNN